jgi:ribosome biogenesis GTPase A
MPEQMNIQWFPGHMTKAQRMIEENMKMVDAVCEIIDARIPYSSRNPDIDRLSGTKPRLVILNRADQADPNVTAMWRAYYKQLGLPVLETDSKTGKGINTFSAAIREVLKEKLEAYAAKGQATRPLSVMILGIPNVGKSTFINKVAGRKAAIAADKPGVTRGKQWITIDAGLELLDTPGILWPRFDSQQVGECLAVTGAIRDEIMDRQTLAANFMLKLRDMYPKAIEQRYKFVPGPQANGFELLEQAAKKRGFLISKDEYDLERMSVILLDEFRDGKLGRLSLERPDTADSYEKLVGNRK